MSTLNIIAMIYGIIQYFVNIYCFLKLVLETLHVLLYTLIITKNPIFYK